MKRRYRRFRRRANVSKQVKQNKIAIKKLKRAPERKHLDVGSVTLHADDDLTSADTYYTLNSGIVRDAAATSIQDGSDRRIGDLVNNKALTIRGYIQNGAQGTATDVIVRILIVRVKSADATAFNPGDILHSLTVNSMYELQNVKNYQVLSDTTFSMDNSDHSIVPFKYRTNLRSKSEWLHNAQSTANDQSDMIRNAYTIMCISSVANNDNAPIFNFSYRWVYTDE